MFVGASLTQFSPVPPISYSSVDIYETYAQITVAPPARATSTYLHKCQGRPTRRQATPRSILLRRRHWPFSRRPTLWDPLWRILLRFAVVQFLSWLHGSTSHWKYQAFNCALSRTLLNRSDKVAQSYPFAGRIGLPQIGSVTSVVSDWGDFLLVLTVHWQAAYGPLQFAFRRLKRAAGGEPGAGMLVWPEARS